MKTSDVITIMLLVLFLALCGWMCVFKTAALVKMGKAHLSGAKFFSA